ncbi:hypothetical protein BT96DRAFT_944249 [Gymnopus androsaceus JB14]|uniref:RNI-like protein n=1 Tax=Gymnopus androsaceus JB14 TaxID=1447944 RepID=A0A6A4H5K1_9AGAR|nr:hypothetical protein BT96DRAFT_944249 [Gymnopus androsaceus JB14]
MSSSPMPPGSPIPPSSFPPHPPPPVRRASTSSVTIPIPGRSILKKPPPPPTGLLSRITGGMGGFGKFFGGNGNNNSNASTNSNPPVTEPPSDRSSTSTPPPDPALKRAHFILPHMAVVYPISSTAPPRTPTTQMEKRAIEERERERRRRVVSSESGIPESSPASSEVTPISSITTEYRYGLPAESRPSSNAGAASWWSVDKVEAFYNECCAACDEVPDPAISRALLQHSSSTSLTTLSTNTTVSLSSLATATTSTPAKPRTLDLTGVSLTPPQAEILADLLSIEWGLRTLILCESNLDPIILKPILHALLLHNTLIFLSVASNAGLASKTVAGKASGYSLNLGNTLKTTSSGSAIAGAGGPVTGWVVLEAYLMRSNLKVLDLSRNTLDKRAMEGVVRGVLGSSEGATAATGTPSTTPTPSHSSNHDSHSAPTLISLTLDATTLKSGALDVLARAVRTSPSLRTLSLRNCRIGSMGSRGGIAVSLMIRDWPDTVVGASGQVQSTIGLTSGISSASSSGTSTPDQQPSIPPNNPSRSQSINRNRPATLTNLDLDMPPSPSLGSFGSPLPSSFSRNHTPRAPPSSTSLSAKPISKPPPRHPPVSEGVPPPPPVHPASANAKAGMQTTYTPYVPRSKRAAAAPPTPTLVAGELPLLVLPLQPKPGVVNSIIHGRGGAGAQPVPPSVAALHSASAALLSQVRALDALPRIGSLRTLDLRGNELRSHVSYLAQVLKRNRTLKTLNLQDNKLDPKALAVIAEALKYNAALEELDLGRNPCCGAVVSFIICDTLGREFSRRTGIKLQLNFISCFNGFIHIVEFIINIELTPTAAAKNSSAFYSTQALSGSASSNVPPSTTTQVNLGLEGIHALRLALALNTTLTRLSLSATHLGDAGAIALAEWMGEYNGLRWLDLTRNSAAELGLGASSAAAGLGLGEAGVMALAQGVKVNRTLRCLDVEVPPGVEGYARLSREILNTCIRNVEASAKEQAEQLERVQVADLDEVIEGQEPAEWRVTKDPVHRARDCVVALGKHLDSSATLANDASADAAALLRRSKTSLDDLANVIAGMLDSSFDSTAKEEKMREVLELSDELGRLVGEAEKREQQGQDGSDADSQLTQMARDSEAVLVTPQTREKPSLRVHVPQKQHPESAKPAESPTTFAITNSPTSLSPTGATPAHEDEDEDEDEDAFPITPSRTDKGKARAPPPPVRHEPVLSPTAVLLRNGVRGASSLGGNAGLGLALAESEDGMSESEGEGENGDEGGGEGEDIEGEPEAGVRSRNWVAEEGEVFRKGNVLLGPEEMEGEYAGEELRRELLEAMVERPAPRSLRLDDADEYGVALPSPSPSTASSLPSTPILSPSTPSIPSNPSMLSGPSTPLATLPEDGYPFNSTRSGGTTPTQELMSLASASTTSPPSAVRPYVPRTRSASAASQSQAKIANGLVLELQEGTDEQGQSKPYISRRRSSETMIRGTGPASGVGVATER